jgi:hypothetical protein
MLYADNICYACVSAAVKLTVVLLYRRIFVTRVFKIITAVLSAIIICWWIAVLLTQVFSCRPVEASWKPALAESCIDTIMFYNAVTISNVILDVIILVLPLPMVWRLHMTSKTKLQVCGVFAVGALYV